MKNRYKYQIMETALDVHMTLTGAFDRGCDVKGDQERDVSFLRERLSDWQDSGINGCEPFDDAVKQVVIEILREHDELWED